MSQQAVKWGQLKKFCDRNGFEIRPSGGDKIIVCPKGWIGGNNRPTVLVGSKCSGHAGDVVFGCYISKIHRTFGVTRQDILAS